MLNQLGYISLIGIHKEIWGILFSSDLQYCYFVIDLLLVWIFTHFFQFVKGWVIPYIPIWIWIRSEKLWFWERCLYGESDKGRANLPHPISSELESTSQYAHLRILSGDRHLCEIWWICKQQPSRLKCNRRLVFTGLFNGKIWFLQYVPNYTNVEWCKVVAFRDW